MNQQSVAMSCVLLAEGVSFAVDEFLARSAFKPNAVFHRGEPRFRAPHPDGAKFSASAFMLTASEADFSQVQLQIADAIHFLEQNQTELARLVAFPGVEAVYLDFGIEERNIAAQSERFPPRLLSILASLGIWLKFTLYPCQESDEVSKENSQNTSVR
jgi:hypothetical protein